MEYKEFVVSAEADHHIVIKPQPHPVHPAAPAKVPEGGSTLLFILVALTAIGWAAAKRYRVQIGENALHTGIAS